eukprot:10172369-Lingulodinium_polyedra.AAC.1
MSEADWSEVVEDDWAFRFTGTYMTIPQHWEVGPLSIEDINVPPGMVHLGASILVSHMEAIPLK